MHDDRPPGSHHAAVSGIDLIGQTCLGGYLIDVDAGLFVGRDHFLVLSANHLAIESEPEALTALGNRVTRCPVIVVDGAYQKVSQAPVFTIDTPFGRAGGAAAVDSSA